jgi:hypothetical protein
MAVPHSRIPLDHALDRSKLPTHIRQGIIEGLGDSFVKQDRGEARAVYPNALKAFSDPSHQLPQVTNKASTIGIDARGPVPDLTQERDERIRDATRVLAVVGKR